MSDNRQDDDKVKEAKVKELENWKKFNVYEEIIDTGQPCISVRWVSTEKQSTDGQVVTKARLVARGFEECKDYSFRSDAPTAEKRVLRIFLALLASNQWKCNCIDIKSAFLQGKTFEREVYLRPPVEAENSEGKVWKLNKCVYGLNDTARVWYFTVRNALLSLGCKQLKVDPAMFYWYQNDKLAGMFLVYVNDFIWGGTKRFEETDQSYQS